MMTTKKTKKQNPYSFTMSKSIYSVKYKNKPIKQ